MDMTALRQQMAVNLLGILLKDDNEAHLRKAISLVHNFNATENLTTLRECPEVSAMLDTIPVEWFEIVGSYLFTILSQFMAVFTQMQLEEAQADFERIMKQLGGGS